MISAAIPARPAFEEGSRTGSLTIIFGFQLTDFLKASLCSSAPNFDCNMRFLLWSYLWTRNTACLPLGFPQVVPHSQSCRSTRHSTWENIMAAFLAEVSILPACNCQYINVSVIIRLIRLWFIRFAIGRDHPVKRVFTILFIAIFGSWKLFGSWHSSKFFINYNYWLTLLNVCAPPSLSASAPALGRQLGTGNESLMTPTTKMDESDLDKIACPYNKLSFFYIKVP